MNAMNVRFNMKDFVMSHSHLHHVSGVTYRTLFDKTHRKSRIEINISRDLMAKVGWHIGTWVDIEWDNCRMYLVRRDGAAYKIRTSHSAYRCHPQAKVPGRFVGNVYCAYKEETKLPKCPKRQFCENIKFGNKTLSFKLPQSQ